MRSALVLCLVATVVRVNATCSDGSSAEQPPKRNTFFEDHMQRQQAYLRQHLRGEAAQACGQSSGAVVNPIVVGDRFSLKLGALYDYRKGVNPGGVETPFSAAQLANATTNTSGVATEAQISTSTSFSQRSHDLDIQGSISLDLSAIKLSGSAQYLKDADQSALEARVALTFNKLASVQAIRESDILYPAYPQVLQKYPSATHVITGIQYGSYNVFSFSQTVQNVSEKQNICGQLSINIKAIKVSGSAQVNITNTQRSEMQNTSCTLRADTDITSLPLTMLDALDAVKQIAANTAYVAVKAYLTPVACIGSGGTANWAQKVEESTMDNINKRMDTFESDAAAAGLWVPTTLYSFSQNFKSAQQQYVDGMNHQIDLFLEALLPLVQTLRGENNNTQTPTLGKILALLDGHAPLTKSNYDLYQTYKQDELDGLHDMLDTARKNKQLYCNDPVCLAPWATLLGDPSIDYIVAIDVNLYCDAGSDKFVQCMLNNCNDNSSAPTSWTQNPAIVNQLNKANSAYNLLYSYNANGVPSSSEKVVFGVHESSDCNPPSVRLQVYQQNNLVAANITNVPVFVTSPIAKTMNPPCPPTIEWSAHYTETPNVTIGFRAEYRIGNAAQWTPLQPLFIQATGSGKAVSILAPKFNNNTGASTYDLRVRPICEYTMAQGNTLQLYCDKAANSTFPVVKTQSLIEYAKNDPTVHCAFGDCRERKFESPLAPHEVASSCLEWRRRGRTDSNWYWVRSAFSDYPQRVHCLMDANDADGGWTTIQSNTQGSNFMRPWSDYARGFSTNNQPNWLGLQKLYWETVVAVGNLPTTYQLLVVVDRCGQQQGIIYNAFKVDCEAQNFTLHVDRTYTQTPPGMTKAADALNYPGNVQNGQPFSTYDRDSSGQCASERGGGFWYTPACGPASPNGNCYGTCASKDDGILWDDNVKTITMAIRTAP